jgi:hypothetical protein
MLRQALLGVAVVFAGAAAAPQGQEIKLQWKFKEGEKIYVEDVMVSKLALSVLGQVQESEEKTTMVTSYTVTKVTSSKIEMVMKIEDADSRGKGGLGGQLGKFIAKTKGATFNVVIQPDGKVEKFEGYKDLEKKILGGVDEETAKMFQAFLNEEMFIQSVEQAFGVVPGKAIKKGDSWTRDGRYPLGPLGDFKCTNTYTYEGKGDGGEEISLKQNMQYVPPKGGQIGGLLKIVKGDLKGEKAKGTLIFNAEKGRMVSYATANLIRGTLKVEIGGQEYEIEVSMDNAGTAKVHEKNPVKD